MAQPATDAVSAPASPSVEEARRLAPRAKAAAIRLAEFSQSQIDAIAASKAYSLAGGGDTIAAINKFGVAGEIDYISTAGGAFLEFLEGKSLPAIEILQQRALQEA